MAETVQDMSDRYTVYNRRLLGYRMTSAGAHGHGNLE